MRRLAIASVAGLLLLSCCGGGSQPASSLPDGTPAPTSPASSVSVAPSTTGPPPTTATTSTSSTTPTTLPPSTTAPPYAFPADPYRDLPAIVTADDGVYEVGFEGNVRQLVRGRVAFAIDDGQGGLLFQMDRGRSWEGAGSTDTTIWWVEAGTSEARELLVPTTADGHELSLHDAYVDGGIHVVYTRHEGEQSDQGWPFNVFDRVRSFDLATRTAIDLISGAAWEAGIGAVQCGAGVISFSEYNQIGSNCEFVDYVGNPVTVPADVETVACEIDCRRSCAIGWEGDLLMYSRDHFTGPDTVAGSLVVFTNAHTALEIARVVHLGTDLQAEFVDLLGNRVLLSWLTGPAVIYDMSDLAAGGTVLPIDGVARFATAPLELPDIVRLR